MHMTFLLMDEGIEQQKCKINFQYQVSIENFYIRNSEPRTFIFKHTILNREASP